MDAASILAMEFASSSSKENLGASTNSASIKISIQNINSCISLRAISYLEIKSLVDWAAFASEQFAPTRIKSKVRSQELKAILLLTFDS